MKVDPPELLIRPKVGRMNFMEFHRADEVIRAGYAAAMSQMDDIRALARHSGFPDLGKRMRDFSNHWKKR
jgi:predicted acylesterase/phospholipase RssA